MTSIRPRVTQWFHQLLLEPRPTRGRALAIGAVCSVVVAVIGVVDVSTGADLTLGAVYLLPVAVGVVLVGTGCGMVMVAETAVVGLAADLVRRHDTSVDVHIANGAMRAAMLMIVVALIAGFRSVLDRARTSDQRSQQFLAFAAHQLRTPIASVRAASDALVLEGVDPKAARLLQRIASDAARCGRLVTGLLRMARLDQGEVLPTMPTDVRALVADEVERTRALNPLISVDYEVGDAVPELVAISPEAAAEALQNVLDNARRFARTRIELVVDVADHTLTMTITDDGPGVAPAMRDRIFERFATLDDRGGSGLGLPIARGLAESQGGGLVLADDAFVLTMSIRPLDGPSSRGPRPARAGSSVNSTTTSR
ncbi:MAG TPA: HAMP domain-containing sensor histidine kinase [Acidimicrobiales bacterium]|nr:HAMP domain-containing sensor histidine kinase [Acidimicrobiales bacterium]